MSCRLISIALTIPFIVAILPKPVEAQATPVAVTACYANAACRVVVVLIGGLYYWQITQNGQTTNLRYEEGEVLEDPEGESEEWSDRIWGDDPTSAERRCREYAHTNGVVYVRTRHLRGRAYECTVRSLRA